MSGPGTRGRLFVISGPSGVGKGTVVQRLLRARSDLVFAVSSTTRAPRPGEVEGQHYRFVTPRRFDEMAEGDAFLEWAEIFGARYGTPAEEVERARRAGRDVLVEVDVQGARSVRRKVPDAVLIFLEPPTEDELARRLRARGTEAGASLERRLAEARRELTEAEWFDHRVVNDDVEEAAKRVLAIINA